MAATTVSPRPVFLIKLILSFPSDRIVPVCVNRGTPAVLAEPSSEFAKAIVELAKAVMTPADKQAKPRKRLSLSRS